MSKSVTSLMFQAFAPETPRLSAVPRTHFTGGEGSYVGDTPGEWWWWQSCFYTGTGWTRQNGLYPVYPKQLRKRLVDSADPVSRFKVSGYTTTRCDSSCWIHGCKTQFVTEPWLREVLSGLLAKTLHSSADERGNLDRSDANLDIPPTFSEESLGCLPTLCGHNHWYTKLG